MAFLTPPRLTNVEGRVFQSPTLRATPLNFDKGDTKTQVAIFSKKTVH
jgi:hypothetical protein